MAISVRLSKDEENLIKRYAEFHGLTVSELIRNSIYDKIEEQYELKLFEEAYDEYEKDNKKSRPIEELWKELEL